MTTINVSPLSPFSFNTTIGTPGMPNPLNFPPPQKFRGLRGVFKITVTRWNPPPVPATPPYYFSFVMKGGTGQYQADPGRPFFYLQETAVDNESNRLQVTFERNTTFNTVKIQTAESPSVLYEFTFPVSISQWSFPTVTRGDIVVPPANEIIGPVTIKVENYMVNYI